MDRQNFDWPPRSISSTTLQRLKEGNDAKWRVVIDLFHDSVKSWFQDWRICEADAEVLMQDVFARAWKGIKRFRRDKPGSSFRKWIWRIAAAQAHACSHIQISPTGPRVEIGEALAADP